MTHINVVTMKVTTPVYTMVIVLSLVVCPSVNQKWVILHIDKAKHQKFKKKELRNICHFDGKR
jgi:hypothetical protein